VPDFLPVRLQDQLRHCKSAVREQQGEQVSAENGLLRRGVRQPVFAFSANRKKQKEKEI
jgi:hypothetical protein